MVRLNDLMSIAEASFAFLESEGFTLMGRSAATTDSFLDGWWLRYEAPLVQVRVEYSEMQFDITFARADVSATYLFIDREIFGQASGLHGDMFPADKLTPVIQRVAADIRTNYAALLHGEAAIWGRVARLRGIPPQARRLP